jgi:putative ABC transport system permease protein
LLQRFLIQTSAIDPVIFGGIAALLATVSCAAAFFPARRAARFDPLAALRHE